MTSSLTRRRFFLLCGRQILWLNWSLLLRDAQLDQSCQQRQDILLRKYASHVACGLWWTTRSGQKFVIDAFLVDTFCSFTQYTALKESFVFVHMHKILVGRRTTTNGYYKKRKLLEGRKQGLKSSHTHFFRGHKSLLYPFWSFPNGCVCVWIWPLAQCSKVF